MKNLTLEPYSHPNSETFVTAKQWRVRGLRGATTVNENSVTAITEAVEELLDGLESQRSPGCKLQELR